MHLFIANIFNAILHALKNRLYFQGAIDHLEKAELELDRVGGKLGQIYHLRAENRAFMAQQMDPPLSEPERTALLCEAYQDCFTGLCQARMGKDTVLGRQIRVQLALMGTRSNDLKLFKEAQRMAKSILAEGKEKLAQEMDYAFLYNLAAWYSLAGSFIKKYGRAEECHLIGEYYALGRYFLACSMLRDEKREFWADPVQDPDLSLVVQGETGARDIKRLQEFIKKEARNKKNPLYKKLNSIHNTGDFQNLIENLLNQSRWSLKFFRVGGNDESGWVQSR